MLRSVVSALKSNKSTMRLGKFIYYLPHNLINIPTFIFKGVRCGGSLETLGKIYVRNYGEMSIGKSVRIISGWRYNPIGCGDRTSIQVLRGGKLQIGDFTGISNSAITCGIEITIGMYVRIGSGCRIYDTNFHSLAPMERVSSPQVAENIGRAPVVIEDYAFIGAGCFILKGSRVGARSIIGAGSVVTGEVPPDQIWAGNPARFIRSLTADELRGFESGSEE